MKRVFFLERGSSAFKKMAFGRRFGDFLMKRFLIQALLQAFVYGGVSHLFAGGDCYWTDWLRLPSNYLCML